MKPFRYGNFPLSRAAGEGGEHREPGGGFIQLQTAPSPALPRLRGRGGKSFPT